MEKKNESRKSRIGRNYLNFKYGVGDTTYMIVDRSHIKYNKVYYTVRYNLEDIVRVLMNFDKPKEYVEIFLEDLKKIKKKSFIMGIGDGKAVIVLKSDPYRGLYNINPLLLDMLVYDEDLDRICEKSMVAENYWLNVYFKRVRKGGKMVSN
jgi:hypothetical protein